ncbi:MAG: prepilin peptidase [Verrucomicrobiota bacterium]
MSLPAPSASQERFRQKPAVPAPRGLDRQAKGLVGLWKRRGAVRRSWERSVETALAQAELTAALSDEALDARLAEQAAFVGRAGFPEGLASAEMLALVAETAWRTVGLRPYAVQLLAVQALLSGYLAEIDTGEGKTLSLALAAGLDAWQRKPVHLITANDYLAARDARTMGPLYARLGVSVASVTGETTPPERRLAYDGDVVYTTAKEVVADYLRDRLVLREWDRSGARQFLRQFARSPDGRIVPVQRGLHHAFIDEADNGLIDEAVTPLLISQPREDEALKAACIAAWEVAEAMDAKDHYKVFRGERRIEVLPEGEVFLERVGRFPADPLWLCPRRQRQFVTLGLEAREFFHLGQQYIRASDLENPGTSEIVIVDEATGRPMPNRSWKLGLHQMIEAKEGAPLTVPAETIAQISFQAFFTKYERLAGASGTAREIAGEVWQTYDLPTVRLPRNRPNQRRHRGVRIFATTEAKEAAVIAAIRASRERGQPVLVGTRSVTSSERLGQKLAFQGIPCEILNATRIAEEAEIVKRAGHLGKVTIATNMAGRGTDIAISEGVAMRGGLHVIATEPHESRRVDRQLFGRAARQGDPGEVTAFYALDDELLTRYLVDPIERLLERLLRASATAGVGRWLVRGLIPRAQRRAEAKARRVRTQVAKIDESLRGALGFARER